MKTNSPPAARFPRTMRVLKRPPNTARCLATDMEKHTSTSISRSQSKAAGDAALRQVHAPCACQTAVSRPSRSHLSRCASARTVAQQPYPALVHCVQAASCGVKGRLSASILQLRGLKLKVMSEQVVPRLQHRRVQPSGLRPYVQTTT